MRPILSWRTLVPLGLLLAPATPLTARAQAAPAVQPAHQPDADADGAPVLLTPEGMAAYNPLAMALKRYWAVHPEAEKQAHPTGYPYDRGSVFAVSVTVYDYPTLVQQDTALGALFKQYHVEPAHFTPLQISVHQAIIAVLRKTPVDSTTVAGKNVAFVRAHRAAFAGDWQKVQQDAQVLQAFGGVTMDEVMKSFHGDGATLKGDGATMKIDSKDAKPAP